MSGAARRHFQAARGQRGDPHCCAPGTRCTFSGGTSSAMKAWPMPRVRMKVSRPRFTFLSCAMWRISSSAESRRPGNVADRDRQPGGLQMRAHALRVGRRREPLARRKNRAPAPCRSRPPRRGPGAAHRSRRRLRARAPKVWPRLRSARSPVSRSSAATMRALNAHALGDGADARRRRRRRSPSRFASSQAKNVGVADQPVLRHLRIAGAELALRQRVERRRVGEHQRRLHGTRRRGSCRAAH